MLLLFLPIIQINAQEYNILISQNTSGTHQTVDIPDKSQDGNSRWQPRLPRAIFCSPQKPGLHRSQRLPPTPGRQSHRLVTGSHCDPSAPRRWQLHCTGQPAPSAEGAAVSPSGQQPCSEPAHGGSVVTFSGAKVAGESGQQCVEARER